MKILHHKYLFLSVLLFAGCFIQNKTDEKIIFVDKQGIVNPLIFQLLQATDVVCPQENLDSIVQETQKHWLRKPGLERWDIQDNPHLNQQAIYKTCEKLQLFAEVKPKYKEYEYAFVLGGLFQRMVMRLQHLVDLWNQGIRFNNIVFLTGSRPVNAQQEETKESLEEWSAATIEIMPQTETELLEFIYKHMNMPDQMRLLPVHIIDVPMQQDAHGVIRRPNTADTIAWWLKNDPKPGKIIAISNQPYVAYQDSVLKTLLPASFEVDTVGQACDVNEKIGILLDTLARTLYQEQQRLKK